MSARSAAATAGKPRYETLVKIASGGMATVYVGRVVGALGFQQLIAIKRPHPHLLDDATFRRMLLSEANLASRIRHANVVSVRDVEMYDDSIHLVMDYVEGASLTELLEAATPVTPREELARAAVRILLDACAGLHAAHELQGDDGRPLGLVHRDVSPQNVLVGTDGVGRVVDFGIAKCVHAREGQSTVTGTVKGKTPYMAPEYLRGGALDRRSDVFAMGVVLWEVLAARRLFRGQHEGETVSRVLTHVPEPISAVAPFCGARFDAILSRALAKEPSERYGTMIELAEAIDAAAHGTSLVARHREVADVLQRAIGARLSSRRASIKDRLERTSSPGADDLHEVALAPSPSSPSPGSGLVKLDRDTELHSTRMVPALASTLPLGANARALAPAYTGTLPRVAPPALGGPSSFDPRRPPPSSPAPSSPASRDRGASPPSSGPGDAGAASGGPGVAVFAALGLATVLVGAALVWTLVLDRPRPAPSARADDSAPPASAGASSVATSEDPAATQPEPTSAPPTPSEAPSAALARTLVERPRRPARTSAPPGRAPDASSTPAATSVTTPAPRPLPTNPYR